MPRIRLNQEYRNKVANRMRVHLEQENTQEKEKFFQCRENFKEHQDNTWELAQQCVSRQYPPKDVQLAHYLQDKYPNVNTVEKDSCFHFGYMAKKEGEAKDTSRSWSAEHREQDDKYISKHFDFKLNGDMDGVDRQDDEEGYQPQSRDFAYAYFRDELKGREGCNPDITIEMDGKESNPHWTKFKDANDKYLGTTSGNDNLTSYADKWDKEYELDLIGREYCRDRQIAVSREEFKTFEIWQQAKGQLIMAHYLQDKYENVNTIAKDSCFHFGYMAKKGGEQEDTSRSWSREHHEQDDKYISKHFDFKLNGDMDGVDRQDEVEGYQPQSRDFAYAYFRDELKGREGCNPDITIEMEGKDRNPHEQKYKDANDKYLGFNCGSDNLTSYSAQWDKDYELDLIGREYCRDRQIAVSKEEFKTFEMWQQKKGQLIMAHYKWIKSILNQMKEIKMGLKGYRYLDEAIELCTELGLNVQEDEVIRTNSTGLVIYNPKNLAERIKGMKNKNFSREDKIKARLLYEAQSQVVN